MERTGFNIPTYLQQTIVDDADGNGRSITDQWLWMTDFYFAFLDRERAEGRDGREAVSHLVVTRRRQLGVI